jgi:hypothetical protein
MSMQEEQVQAIRVVNKDGHPAAGYTAGLQIACHFDATSGQQVILWEDIVMPFKDILLYVRYGAKIPQLLKDADLKR